MNTVYRALMTDGLLGLFGSSSKKALTDITTKANQANHEVILLSQTPSIWLKF